MVSSLTARSVVCGVFVCFTPCAEIMTLKSTGAGKTTDHRLRDDPHGRGGGACLARCGGTAGCAGDYWTLFILN
jgi:hypothetical protein